MKKILQAIGAMLMNVGENPEVPESATNQILQDPARAGREFLKFLRNGARVVIGEIKKIFIDRSQKFDIKKFQSGDWKIDEEDERSLKLNEIDLTKIEFANMLKDGETSIVGEEKLRRLKKDGRIRLDAKIFQTLWEDQSLIPESWKVKINGEIRFIYFDGTILRFSDGDRYVLYLYWDDGQWYWDYRWLDHVFRAHRSSAVLASN